MAVTLIFEPAYLEVGTIDNTSPTLSINMQLNKILNTIFNVNKSLYFGGTNATIEITWNTTGYIYYIGTSATVPTSGAAAKTTATLLNLMLQLSIDKNMETEVLVRNKVEKEGLKLVVPYIVSNFILINAATVIMSNKVIILQMKKCYRKSIMRYLYQAQQIILYIIIVMWLQQM